MEPKSDILDKVAHRDGLTVADGYFADFATRMEQMLPQKVAAPEPKKTLWLKVRPYAYMAAMFGGVWCMMRLFGLFMGSPLDMSDINNHPNVLVALNDEEFVKEYVMPSVNEYDMLDDLYDSGLSAQDIFGDYVNIDE